MLVATAGHIDHGKTALIRALTGVETDRLPEEKARGISIDLGFAYWQPEGGETIGFIDVPGHERFVRTMIAGLGGVDLALLVIAADDGVMPQTVEHLCILGLLGIDRVVVALTKVDRVDADRLAAVTAQVTDLLAPTAFSAAPVFPVSALTGERIAALAAALKGEVDARPADEDHLFRLSIDRVFSVAGAGTVVTGTVIAGTAAPGDTLMVSPLGRAVRVRGLQSGGRKADVIAAGQRGAFNLSGIEVGEVHRGDWLIAPMAHVPTQRIEARICPSATLRHDARLHWHHGAADIGARVLVPGQRTIAPGSEAVVRIVLDQPSLAVSGDRFILRDASGRQLIGGVVLDPLASPRRRAPAEQSARTAAMALARPADKLAALADAPGVEPDLDWFARCCNLSDAAMARLVSEGGHVLGGKAQTIVLSPQRYARLGAALEAALGQHHRDHPSAGGMARRAARLALGEPVSADLFAWLADNLTRAGRIVAEGPLLRLPGHAPAFGEQETRFWREALALLGDGAPRPFVVTDIARKLGTSEAATSAMLQRRRASGDLWQVTDSRFMLRDHVAALSALAAGLDSGHGFTAAQFRDASGMGRNFVIQFLEFLDRIGVTRRSGEVRRMRGDWESVVGRSDPD